MNGEKALETSPGLHLPDEAKKKVRIEVDETSAGTDGDASGDDGADPKESSAHDRAE